MRGNAARPRLDLAPIGYPEYMPSGELCLSDPDGYTILVNHWGKPEHDAWLRRIGRSPEGSDAAGTAANRP